MFQWSRCPKSCAPGKISAATRKRVFGDERSSIINQLDRAQPGDPAYLHHRIAAADFTTPFFDGNRQAMRIRCGPHRLSRHHFVFREKSHLEKNEPSPCWPAGGRADSGVGAVWSRGFRAHRETARLRFVLIDRPFPGVRASFRGRRQPGDGQLATAHLNRRGLPSNWRICVVRVSA